MASSQAMHEYAGSIVGRVSEVLAGGDERASLVALRDRLAGAVDECEPRELAALVKQLTEVLRLIESLPGDERSELDDLTAAREKRRAALPKRAGGKKLGGSGSS